MKPQSGGLVGLSMVLLVGYGAAQPPPTPAFDVAVIKRWKADARPTLACGFPAGGRFVGRGTLMWFIACAYSIPMARSDQEIVGGPAWIHDDLYEINASAPAEFVARPYADRLRLLQTLLATRFSLALRMESRTVPMYDLVLARRDGRLGPRLQATAPDCAAWWTGGRRGEPPAVRADDLRCGRQIVGSGSIRGSAMTLSLLSNVLSPQVERPVRDRTGLQGTFDLSLQWSAAADQVASPSGSLPTSVFTALEEQLGLKLEPARGAINVRVVTRVAKPIED